MDVPWEQFRECPGIQVLKRLAPNVGPSDPWLNMVEIWFRIMGRMCLRDSYDSPDLLVDAILEYSETWSEKWAHPFNWTYDGTGLHQKVVLRFIAMLTGSADEITLQLMTKQSLLMVSLMNRYWDKVDPEHWQRHVAELQLRSSLAASTQPLVKKKAEAALAELLTSIETHENKLANSA